MSSPTFLPSGAQPATGASRVMPSSSPSRRDATSTKTSWSPRPVRRARTALLTAPKRALARTMNGSASSLPLKASASLAPIGSATTSMAASPAAGGADAATAPFSRCPPADGYFSGPNRETDLYGPLYLAPERRYPEPAAADVVAQVVLHAPKMVAFKNRGPAKCVIWKRRRVEYGGRASKRSDGVEDVRIAFIRHQSLSTLGAAGAINDTYLPAGLRASVQLIDADESFEVDVVMAGSKGDRRPHLKGFGTALGRAWAEHKKPHGRRGCSEFRYSVVLEWPGHRVEFSSLLIFTLNYFERHIAPLVTPQSPGGAAEERHERPFAQQHARTAADMRQLAAASHLYSAKRSVPNDRCGPDDARRSQSPSQRQSAPLQQQAPQQRQLGPHEFLGPHQHQGQPVPSTEAASAALASGLFGNVPPHLASFFPPGSQQQQPQQASLALNPQAFAQQGAGFDQQQAFQAAHLQQTSPAAVLAHQYFMYQLQQHQQHQLASVLHAVRHQQQQQQQQQQAAFTAPQQLQQNFQAILGLHQLQQQQSQQQSQTTSLPRRTLHEAQQAQAQAPQPRVPNKSSANASRAEVANPDSAALSTSALAPSIQGPQYPSLSLAGFSAPPSENLAHSPRGSMTSNASPRSVASTPHAQPEAQSGSVSRATSASRSRTCSPERLAPRSPASPSSSASSHSPRSPTRAVLGLNAADGNASSPPSAARPALLNSFTRIDMLRRVAMASLPNPRPYSPPRLA